ncbi:MAG TPA: YHYH protein [Ignavibacteria bacterium]|nr:YHYH protein [Ignavibacteria bacterium]
MKKLSLVIIFWGLIVTITYAQITPDIYSWKQNLTGVTGYNGITADVQQVFYSANFSYVKCTGIPSYTIGPWAMNPNTPTNQNWVFKIARFPVADPTPATAGNGQIGVLTNGVVVFNAGDAMSYNNLNIWHRVAQYFEAVSFDTSGGHPAPGGSYHYHINMKKLYTPNSSQHSPILGYMFDGFPLYGPYAYSNTNGTGGIRRMKSGFVKRNITTRTTLPNGTVLPSNQWGPAVSTQYPLGCFIEDYEPATGNADLDIHNGRFSITPEYPLGIYAYFITVDSLGNPEYPYIIGSTYYGEVVAGNGAPGGGHIVISEPVTQYIPTTGIANSSEPMNFALDQNYPNPFNPETNIKFSISKASYTTLKVFDISGKEVSSLLNENLIAGSYIVKFNGSSLSSGIYYYTLTSGEVKLTKKMMLIK